MEKKLIKIITVCMLIFNSLTVDNYAAIVSDNDGSAFVTKAEFDSLKENFNKQIDDYNKSIDGKIDGAIASYLAGIQLTVKETLVNKYSKYLLNGNKNPGNIYWSSDDNISLCDKDWQYLSYNYAFAQAYNDVGGFFSATANSETKERARKRYTLNKNGYIEARKLWRFWIRGCNMTWIGQSRTCHGGSYWLGPSTGVFAGLVPMITNRQSAVYSKAEGSNATGNNWFGCETFLYNETQEDTNEDACIYPLAETSTEYVVDMSKTTQSYEYGSKTNMRTEPEFNFTIANMTQMGAMDKFTTEGDANDYCWIKIKGIFKNMKLADFKYLNFYDIDSANSEIRAGVVIADATANSTIEVSGIADKTGYVIFYSANNADNLWNGQRISLTDTSWKITENKVTANIYFKRQISNVKKDEKIFMLYLPDNKSDKGLITIDTIDQLVDD